MTQMTASISPLGVIVDPSDPSQLLCYGQADRRLQAVRFGTGDVLELTQERLDAIEADRLKHGNSKP